ncbi:undecaprenyl-phosphate glucose phosphotransferase [Lichenicoccus sp.]|uniref:undecaprenyl-phosphate glucose phosphotransferase n=1 Tax=Lichenicoccus sp. TaxID=2781899 RepID=UPI003D0EC021
MSAQAGLAPSVRKAIPASAWSPAPGKLRRAKRVPVTVFTGAGRVVDALALLVAGLAACAVIGIVRLHYGAHLLSVFVGDWMVLTSLSYTGAYRISRLRRPAAQLFCVLLAVMIGMAAVDLCLFLENNMLLPKEPFPEIWAGCTALVLLLSHGLGALLVVRWSASGRMRRNVAVVGISDLSRSLIEGIRAAQNTDLHVVGVYDDNVPANTMHAGVPVLGRVADLLDHGREETLDTIVVAGSMQESTHVQSVCSQLSSAIADVYLMTDVSGRNLGSPIFAGICDRVVVMIRRRPLDDWQVIQKMLFDRVGSLAAIVLLAPVLLTIALLVRLSGPGPIVFRQERVGFNNRTFICFKFRSMHHHRSDSGEIAQATRHDPRVTWIGRWLRKLSLDELPQLFNVLRGDMSLVGPRPHAPATKAGDHYFQDVVTDYAVRHRVKPGITGWAQVNGWRGETRTAQQLQARIDHDFHYIENWSMLFDVRILILTVMRELRSKTAY